MLFECTCEGLESTTVCKLVIRQDNNYGYCRSTGIKPGKLQKIKIVFKFKDLELKVYFLHMDCNLAQYKESWRGGQRRTLTVKIRADLQEN
ncbi:unnamed protein product [Sphagnum jensenii]|uniref:Uncharacterized protein n=1 Tax=Sphagnum jensenii TaxID=128206 RepID=A0ABP1BS98_9BRYO